MNYRASYYNLGYAYQPISSPSTIRIPMSNKNTNIIIKCENRHTGR